MSLNQIAPASATRTSFIAGRDLKAGRYYRNISAADGTINDSEVYLLAVDATDKKGNRQLVNPQTGEVFYASASSVWQS